MNILNEVYSLLEVEGYSIQLISEAKLMFEDESLCGFAAVFSSTKELVENWENVQNNFVKDQTSLLRADMSKAFNIYSIFLTTGEGNEFKSEINTITEDFRISRKIIGFGIQTTQDIRRVLLPLISIQKKSRLETSDYIDRIKSNLRNKDLISSKSVEEIFNNLI